MMPVQQAKTLALIEMVKTTERLKQLEPKLDVLINRLENDTDQPDTA
jgi:hypothetical protein